MKTILKSLRDGIVAGVALLILGIIIFLVATPSNATPKPRSHHVGQWDEVTYTDLIAGVSDGSLDDVKVDVTRWRHTNSLFGIRRIERTWDATAWFTSATDSDMGLAKVTSYNTRTISAFASPLRGEGVRVVVEDWDYQDDWTIPALLVSCVIAMGVFGVSMAIRVDTKRKSASS